jgi:hypothetical protein
MKVQLYKEILKEIQSFSGPGRKCVKYLQEKFTRYDIATETLFFVSFLGVLMNAMVISCL